MHKNFARYLINGYFAFLENVLKYCFFLISATISHCTETMQFAEY